jgi:lactate dehydrogenase-like 2-hydroxyacid dehydrogenase
MKPKVLIAYESPMPPAYMARFNESFDAHWCPSSEDKDKALQSDWLHQVRGVFTSGRYGVRRDLLEAMPALEIICCKGTGIEALDMEEMRRRGLFVTYAAGANGRSVADHAMGLMLATMRQIPQLDSAVRQGKWASSRTPRPIPWRKRLGMLGFGRIGQEIAKRAVAFEMTVSYHARNKRDDTSFAYYATPLDLAKNSDILVVSLPGGEETKKMINRAMLDALGPQGYVINIARGSVVDSDELAAALKEGRIAGAALDVVDGEPDVPSILLDAPNLVMTPHMGARSPEAQDMTYDLAIDNLQAHFAGKPVLTPAPGSAGRRREGAQGP